MIFTFEATAQKYPSYWSIDQTSSYLASSPFLWWQKNFRKSNLFLIFTFQATAQEASSYLSIDQAPSYLASIPFLQFKY